MIEFRIQPGIETMAGFACRREIRARMIWICRLLIVLQVAGDALRGEALKYTDRRALMARFALHSGMCAKKRKSVLVILHLLNGYVPSAYRVALCAVGSELPSMNICVAIRTILSYVREHRFCVALRALHFFVRPSQRIVCVVVIEFRMRTYRPPATCCVTIFTGNRERSVWTAGPFFLGDGWDSQPD
jgi:hypothetical protein